MVDTIIGAFPKEKREARKDGSKVLNVAEFFMNTVQGENIMGNPAMFLRLQFCTLNCKWCDTAEVWRKGNPYSTIELLDLMEEKGAVEQLRKGQRLILTGGSPVKQQDALADLLYRFFERFNFVPFVEVENECTLMPNIEFAQYISIWNNSPKLENSGNKKELRYKPDVIRTIALQENAFFKFVITCEEDWEEIQRDFLDAGLIKREQIVVMPEGVDRKQLQSHYESCVNLACREGVRFSDRLQVTIWDKTTGV